MLSQGKAKKKFKFVFSTTLLIVFFFFFGCPSWNKFQAREILINKRKIITSEISAPAITICVVDESDGWKNESRYNVYDSNNTDFNDYDSNSTLLQNDGPNSYILDQCKESNSVEEALECINTKTYNLTETVSDASAYSPNNYTVIDILNSSLWISDISCTLFGKCHTLNVSDSLSLSKLNLNFNLDSSLNYLAYLHDPNFFILTANPATIPGVSLDLNPSQGLMLKYIEVIQHINMDRSQQTCEDREDYSFTTCVKNSVSSKIGCR